MDPVIKTQVGHVCMGQTGLMPDLVPTLTQPGQQCHSHVLCVALTHAQILDMQQVPAAECISCCMSFDAACTLHANRIILAQICPTL